MSSTRPVTWTWRAGRVAFEHVERDVVAGRDAEHVGEHQRQHDPGRRHADRAAVAIDDALEARVRRHAGDREIALAMARADACGDGSLRLDGDDAGQPRERVAARLVRAARRR